MLTPCYSSMCICMCQNFSTQTHSSPEVDRQGAAFTPFQYKQHMKKLKSGSEPNAIPNIPNFTSGSESLKPYSRSQKLTPPNLGMIISAILSLRHNIAGRASCILTPALNLLIKSIISSSGGHFTPTFHIPQDLSTIFDHLQLEPLIEYYIFCHQFFTLNGFSESVMTDQPHCQRHN
ncbi:hypothetical protein O181_116765 [Austropuccinia psidii MF-1]|uniref:Uncharacterized protein n=1 Tax=Austropuccinia psidii MF-1 TaxID=1389203 RepID=A0A9Q3K918_9BASI|nr:hypothetical protein [Austropuccinia psidii MF-1]